MASTDAVIVLSQRLLVVPAAPLPALPLTAAERRISRGRREAEGGVAVLLQLPREGDLKPGDVLADADGTPQVVVSAKAEPLLLVSAAEPLALLQAAYHLGNRHVALELHTHELLLLADSVLEAMLRQRGLTVQPLLAPFQPEAGAYSGHGHQHA